MASYSVLLPILLLLPLFLLLLSIKLVFYKKSIKLPPSPPKLPFIGNLHQLGSLPHQSLHTLAKKHGPLMLLHLGEVPTLVVSSAEMAQEVLNTHDPVLANRPSLKSARILFYECHDMGFAPYGEHWRQMRRISMTQLLGVKRVQSYRAMRMKEVTYLIKKIVHAASSSPSSSSSSRVPVNLSRMLFFFTNDMLCRVMLGDFSREEGTNELFREMIEENVALLSGFSVEDYFPSLGWICSLLGLYGRAKRTAEKWDRLLDKMIKDHTNRKEEKNEDDIGFLDILLSLQKDPNMNYSLKNDHIKALLVDMFSGGTDSSSAVLEWAMAELIRKPETMKRLQDEVRSIVGRKPMVEEEDLSAMSYLKAVLKEILRLHPPASLLLPRESMETCQIEGYEIPKHTRVVVNAWSIARDPKFWEEPEEFRPERFLNSSVDFRGHDYHYIPFGAGRRVCPGMNLALATTEFALANIVHRFDWALPEGMVAEDLDMSESSGLSIRKKKSLYLVPSPWF